MNNNCVTTKGRVLLTKGREPSQWDDIVNDMIGALGCPDIAPITPEHSVEILFVDYRRNNLGDTQ